MHARLSHCPSPLWRRRLQAIEVGPYTNVSGPGLLLLKGVTLTPAQVSSWMAKSCIHWVATRIYWLQPGLEAASEEELLAQLAAMGPPPGPCRLQVYPRSKELAFGNKLPLAWDLHPVAFEHVLHAVEMGGRWRYALQPAEGLFQNPFIAEKRVPGQVCKATSKLVEALEVTGFAPHTGSAIDLGEGRGGGRWPQGRRQGGRTSMPARPSPA